MPIWAIADLHLALATPEKGMHRFGAQWIDHHEKIEAAWRACVGADDLVLIAGDISWAMQPNGAKPDLDWIAQLPGQKLLIRGNHDYWWPASEKRLRELLPPTLRALRHDALLWRDTAIAGARLWDMPGVSFDRLIAWRGAPLGPGPLVSEQPPAPGQLTGGTPERILSPEDARILGREMEVLRRSLAAMPAARRRICMTHYPPLAADGVLTPAARLIEAYAVDCVVFGHLHNVVRGQPLLAAGRHTSYLLTSCDYLDFRPLRIADD